MKYLLNEFYSSLKNISTVNSDLNEKRAQLKEYTYAFNELVQSKTVDKNIAKQNEEMAKVLNETLGLIKNSSQAWIDNFEEMLEKEKFRSDLENYFIIIIFGKVKAGKSSLGNFIANNKLKEQKVEFFKYDEAGKKQDIKKLEEINEESFDTNNLECTVEIQGFKLEGMAWIDTPGLGSMVKENGDLAKEYIQSADYIIYPTSSDSPLQQDEREQLKELFEQNKKVTICITKSDEKEEDECECGSEEGCSKCNEGLINVLKNKSSEKRKSQEIYVNDQISKLIDENKESVLGDIFSISTHTATKGIEEKNSELFKNSNIPKFYELITEVVKEKSKKLKEGTPYDGLKSFINNNILGNDDLKNKNSIQSIEKNLLDLNEKIDESIEKFTRLKENANSDFESETDSVIAEYVSKINKHNSKDIFAKIDAELNKKVSEAIQKNIHEIFADFDTTLKSLTTSLGSDDFEIKDKFKKIEYTTKERNKKIGSGLFGTLATIATGIALASNPIGWAAAGTMAAGVVGSYVGGKIGETTGSKDSEEIVVGDNKEEVIERFKSSRLTHYESFAKNLYVQMQDTFFKPLKNISQDIRLDLDKFEKNIKNLL